jgi:hypothetical protein
MINIITNNKAFSGMASMLWIVVHVKSMVIRHFLVYERQNTSHKKILIIFTEHRSGEHDKRS